MLVERTFSVVDNPTGDTGICYSCPINEVCLRFVDRKSGEVITDKVESFSSQSYDFSSTNFVKKNFYASICLQEVIP